MRRLIALVVLTTAPILAMAQDRPQTPAQVEQAVRRRVEAWLKERAPAKLACPGCKGSGRDAASYQECELCGATGVNPHRIDNALWALLRPSFRRGRDKDAWLLGQKTDGRYRWGSGQAMASLTLGSVTLARDLAWAEVRSSGVDEFGQAAEPMTDCWVKEEGKFYLDMTGEPGEDVLKHEWFVVGTFSLNSLSREVERLHAGEEATGATDFERAKHRADREKAEQAIRERAIADAGVVENVRLEHPRDGQPFMAVLVKVGLTEVLLDVRPGQGETAEQLSARVGALQRGARVAFRGKPTQWRRSETSLLLERVDMREGEVTALR